MGKRRYEEVCRLSNGHSQGITAVAFSAQGTYLATSGLDGKVCIWLVENGTLLIAYCGKSPILSLAWMPYREDALLCGGKDGNIALLTVTPNAVYVNGFYAHRYPVECLAIESDCVASGAHRELKVWRWRSSARRFVRERTLPEPPKSSHNEYKEIIITSLHWSTSQTLSTLLVSYLHHGIHIFQAGNSWMRVRTIPLQCMIAGTSISNLGNIAVSNLVSGFDVYRMDTEVPVGLFDHAVGEPYPTPVHFIHGGHALVGGSSVGQIDIWDLRAGKMCTLSVPSTSSGWGR
ncbi:WD40 repeat-like protein [Lentinus tigrinus ALCF2SS1-7]|uniref:WD40 repeat-like protein n=1 Tax=Lentinus tigrinus ALCF2SS1-6 TaxID=1328759 RepID=A0A5C2S3P8_9APHY|nr:WD40 repeat-like protein [Lentinus tigrinus ALCF2SS1-6]RPD72184.1 WD40 repeat-like protein [Lentinus tigrinus ALCF2SS1-7]